jgi:ribosomal protein S18 acetylase RimI-like enzyme
MNELERCIAFVRWLDDRCAERKEPTRFGTAYLCESLPRVWSLNYLALDPGAEASADDVATESDRVLAGFLHRKVVTDNDDLGSGLAQRFRQLGWRACPLLVMPFAGAGRRAAHEEVREVDLDTLAPVWIAGMQRSEWGDDDEAVRQVVGQRRVIGAAGSARYFAAFVEGAVASYCELYSDGETGQIEGVLTLEQFRGRGLASAVVTRVRLESEAAGHSLTFLIAEEDDWPKELYRKLGFLAAGRIWDFLKPPQLA